MRETMRSMRSARALAALVLGFGLGALARPAAALPDFPEAKKATLSVAADRTAYEPGATARLAAQVTVEPGWHVNAHEPTFEYLIPTVLEVEPPSGWPQERVTYPRGELQKFAFETEPLSVYDGELAIFAALTVPAGAAPGKVPVRVTLSYQACNDRQCLPPVEAQATLELAVGPGGQPDKVYGAVAALAQGGGPAGDEEAPVEQDPERAAAVAPEDEPGAEQMAAAPVRAGIEEEEEEEAVEAAGGPSAGTAGPAAAAGGLESIALMLVLALAGGLILNVMPCVLPVLSLKVFGLVRSAGHGRREVVRGALATAAGILISFWALAAAAVGARAAGAAVGWGVQFQRPGFVALLALIVVLFCLNLWGLFEIPLPQRLARLGGAGAREGVAGHFASGLFATLMATPCSAPFLGTAIGFALAQETAVIAAIFTAVGVGMALPYLLIAVAPGIAGALPRPGAWMEQVRGVMGFLLAAAAVWLFYVLASQVSPERLAMVQLALLALALFAWLRYRTGGNGVRRAATAGMAAAALATVALAIFGLGGEAGAAGGGAQAEGAPAKRLIEWVPFDRQQAESLAASGQLVFVDVTADWCFTCKVNERLVLETPEVAGAFAENAVVAMKADWTNRDDAIAAYLAEHGRYGIPFYVLYRPGETPHVFSELLTKGDVVEVVRRSGQVARDASGAGPS